MRIAYIAHPIAGDTEENLRSLRKIINTINRTEPETVPFCPYYADVVSLNDNYPLQRARGLKNNSEILKRGFIDELRLYGPRISEGMGGEIELALIHGIPVICGNVELFSQLAPIIEKFDRLAGTKNGSLNLFS